MTSRRSTLVRIAAALAAWPLAMALGTAQAQGQAAGRVDLAGVKYEPEATVAGSKLVLNGAGIRYKAIFKVYTAGLYMPAKTQSADAVVAPTAPRRLHIVMLRDIDGNELGKLFTRGMEQNMSRDEFSKVIPGVIQMSELFSSRSKLATNENFTVDWVPGQGTVILVNGKPSLVVKEPAFYTALMKIWLGNSPADHLLKDALLGVQRQQSSTQQ